MSFDSITNRGEFFSNHYLEAVLGSDLGDLRSSWDDREGRGESTARSRLKGGAATFFAARADANEAPATTRDEALQRLHNVVLGLLGFEPARTDLEFKQNTEHLLDVPVAARVETSTGLLLVAIEAGNAPAVDDLFDFDARQTHTGVDQPGQLRQRVFRHVDNRAVYAAGDAAGEIFNTDEPPRYVLTLGGSMVLLAERAKWSEGRYLAVDLGLAFDRNDSSARGELETIAALFSADALVPVDGQSALETLVDKSHKHAVGVSKELRSGIRESIEIIANEVITQRDVRARERNQKLFTRTDVDAKDLTRQALRYLYRLIVLLYAESRPELGIVPADDEDYIDGYSLDRLRELCLVELEDDHARNGSHFQQSLDKLFELVNGGYHAESAEQQLLFTDAFDGSVSDVERRSTELYIQFPGLDAQLFSPGSTSLINEVPLRNEALQQVLRKLMLAPGKRRNDAAGFISYAQLGINQLGAVYEGLMAYTGFYANTDLYEVAKGGDPTDGTWMLPVADADEYPDEVFVTTADEVTGRKQRVMHAQGSFVFRLSGRDRQRSASYYTPEVLTRCVVKHALAELLGLDDYAPEHGSSGITNAVDLLDLTICEPALGSGAFANEAINQLSAEYLRRREAELDEVLNPARRDLELQKVKAHFALHQTYGVDLNATAVELAEVSLWLNAMYPGLKAPWFGLQLRQGNSLIGCRRATWTTSQLGDRPWANTTSGSVQPPVDRPLTEPLNADEIHHFLLPGHGWAAVADRKEAKELRPDEVESLKAWRKQVLKAPTKAEAKRLASLASGVEAMWASAAERIRLTKRALRRSIDIYGAPVEKPGTSISRAEAIKALNDADSALGRLRTLMDAWVGLWFWPLDTGVRPPSWGEWLAVAEDLIRPDERQGLTGQLELFDDLGALLDAERELQQGQHSVQQILDGHPWFSIAVGAARLEGAWHWELEFAPEFQRGGFDLQVGNPPWVRLDWQDSVALAEHDPSWAVDPPASIQEGDVRRSKDLLVQRTTEGYLRDIAEFAGLGAVLGSPVLRPLLAGVRTNLYMTFMDTVFRHMSVRGSAGLLHPEGHFADRRAVQMRRTAYRRERRHLHFVNDLLLFADVGTTTEYGVHIYCAQRSDVRFLQVAQLLHPLTAEASLDHDGSGPSPGLQLVGGGWDLRPHRDRVVVVDSTILQGWAALFDPPGTPADEAQLMRPVSVHDLGALAALGASALRLGDLPHYTSSGWHQTNARRDRTITEATAVPGSVAATVLQAPHFSVALPVSKQPNENCASHQDYSTIDLENLHEDFVPRTNFQVIAGDAEYRARCETWGTRSPMDYFRVFWGRRSDIGTERTLQAALFPPGPMHVHLVYSLGSDEAAQTVRVAGMWASLPLDYLVRAGGKDVQFEVARRLPVPEPGFLDECLALRVLRLNALTSSYAPLWMKLFEPSWRADRWTDPGLTRLSLSGIEPTWSIATPLRRDQDRWQALIEIDALATMMLGLTADQLCAMYRTQFAVLRKYEYKMVFDAEGRKICGYHQSAGFRQSQVQSQAKSGDLPAEWKNLWTVFEQYESDPDSVDWRGLYTAPFTRVDREAAMTRAYNEFQRRVDVGEYGRV